jgi:UMP-CMP kinase
MKNYLNRNLSKSIMMKLSYHKNIYSRSVITLSLSNGIQQNNNIIENDINYLQKCNYSITKSLYCNSNIYNNKNNFLSKLKIPKVFFILGGPGSGKGTQCELLSNKFGLKHISAGELLRRERILGTELGKIIDSYLIEGNIVPVQISLDLLLKEMQLSSHKRFLIDGFPRNQDNMNGWNKNMKSLFDLQGIVYIDCPENVLESRLLNRGLTSGRNDDNIKTVKKRFSVFKECSLPIIQSFQKYEPEKLIHVYGNESIDEVFNNLSVIIQKNNKLLIFVLFNF